jgi:hypothetical protein
MIDTRTETPISFADAADAVPLRRADKPCNVNTIHRWASQGSRGVRLETVWIGGIRCTSREALERFFAAVTQARSGEPVSAA